MDWNNVNLNDSYERDQNFLDPYNFDTLLLEINCNIREENLNRETIKAEAEKQIKLKLACALEILESNLDNITRKAIEERKDH